MAGSWFLDGIFDGDQHVPAALVVYGFKAMELDEPRIVFLSAQFGGRDS
jgi:hypothetical protein